MIPRALEVEILRLHHAEHWPIGTLARQLHVHHTTVRRVLAQDGVPLPPATRPTLLDPYVAFIVETWARHPTLRASRLYRMARERGYRGSPDRFRHLVAPLRPRPAAEAYLRLRSLPGEEAQVDWAHFGKLSVGRARRPLMAFVMVLSYSRHLFLRFYLNAGMASFLHGHVAAFNHFAAVPRTVLYDNLKSAVLERAGDAIRFHPTILQLAAWGRFQPKPVAVARGNEKGRVERAIRFVRDRFFAARAFTSLDDLNAQARQWCTTEAAERPCPEDRDLSVRMCFEKERERLLPLPPDPFPCQELLQVQVHKTPYARFDLNDYSVPHTHVRRSLTVLASVDTVRIVDGTDVIACHLRSYDRAAQVEDPAHIQALVDHKRAGRAARAIDRLHHAAPSATPFFALAAERGVNLGALTRGLLELLDTHGAAALNAALAAALTQDAAYLGAVRQLIDQERARRGQRPPIAVDLPNDPRVRDLTVRPHPLTDYERLVPEDPDGHPDEQPGTGDDGDDDPGA